MLCPNSRNAILRSCGAGIAAVDDLMNKNVLQFDKSANDDKVLTFHDSCNVARASNMGDIIGDLNSRRGNVSGMDQRGNARVINAMVPLANMFGYVNTLRSMSQGRSQYTMHFDHYEQVPQAVADEVTAKMA